MCPFCKITYDDFRTGFTYYDIYHMIFNRQYKRRKGVLGKWHELKLEMWNEHLKICEMVSLKVEEEKKDDEENNNGNDFSVF